MSAIIAGDNKKEVIDNNIESLWTEAMLVEARWRAELVQWVKELGMWETFS